MTVVLGVVYDGRAVMAADSAWDNSQFRWRDSTKITLGSHVLVGDAGTAGITQAASPVLCRVLDEWLGGHPDQDLHHRVIKRAWDAATEGLAKPGDDDLFGFAVVTRRSAWWVDEKGYVQRHDDGVVYMGGGGPMAYAAYLALGRHTDLSEPERVKAAVEVIAEHGARVDGPVQVEMLR